MEIIFYGHDQDGEQEEVQTVRVSIDGRELGTMRLTREKATRLLRYSVASREKDFEPEVHFRGKFIGFETKYAELETEKPAASEDGESPSMEPGYFVFAVVDNDDECLEAKYLVYIGVMAEWKAEHRLSDNYEDHEQAMLDPVLESLGLEDLQESTFECHPEIPKEEMRAQLLAAGLVEDPEFQKFMESCDG